MPPPILIAVVGAFLTVALIAGAVTSWWLGRSAPEMKRLRKLEKGLGTDVIVGPHRLTEGPQPGLARLTRLMPKSPKDMSRLRRRLTQAGYPDFEAAAYYSLAEMVLPVLSAGTVLLVLGVSRGLPYALLGGAVGFALPGLYVKKRTAQRQKVIQNSLPDALDLLTICVEAGNGLEQSIAKTSEELQFAHPLLSEEMRLVTTETRAGKPRLEALKNLVDRTGVEDVRTLVAMLAQTSRFGTSIADALRTHAETSRTKRRQRAEERAAKVSVKLAFPLALCLFPALYVVCFGSVVVALYRAFASGVL